MKHLPLIFHAAALGLAVSTALLACDENPDADFDSRKTNPRSDESSALPEALQCTVKPAGRSYTLFDGTKLEEKRRNENATANRARFKPFGVLSGEYQRILGVIPKSLDAAGASFDAPPERWFAEPSHSGVSLSAAFDLSFEACNDAAPTAEQAGPPTDDSAKRYCTTLMRKAWSQSASPDELAACVDLATKKLEAEPDPRRRWSYVCASVLSSSHFLTY